MRCASYPDADQFQKERADIERAWPAYAEDKSMCQIPAFVSEFAQSSSPHLLTCSSTDEWLQEGQEWATKYNVRRQHVMSRMNHHIHPLIDEKSGERKLLSSCKSTRKKEECKSGFPLDLQLSDTPFVVCPCIAEQRQLSHKGPRSALGCVFPTRNNAWQNAGPPSFLAFFGDNADVKFPHRLPIIPETHEKTLLYDVSRCVGKCSMLELAYQVQIGQAMTAGYFGGYASKMLPIGKAELEHLHSSLERKIEVEHPLDMTEGFKHYGKRLVKDLEGKGLIRTAVEGANLALYAYHPDVLMAECIRTFPSVI